MSKSFDVEGYSDHVDSVMFSCIGNIPKSERTLELMRGLFLPRIDEFCQGMPAIRELPDPGDIKRLASTIGNLLLELRNPPTLSDIAEYTASSVANEVEIMLCTLPNGLTAFSVGSSDMINLYPMFAPHELMAASRLHTHSSYRAAGTEKLGVSLHAARIPSAPDVDFARTMGPTSQYIADEYGITHFTSPQSAVPAKVMLAAALPDLNNVSDAAIESIYYPAAMATLSGIQTRPWNEVRPTVTMQDLIPYSNFQTGDQIPANVFAS